jgi:hypothetical protein
MWTTRNYSACYVYKKLVYIPSLYYGNIDSKYFSRLHIVGRY